METGNNWFVDCRGVVAQVDRETPLRLYYGKKTKSWRGKERQDFIDKSTVIARDLTAATAEKIAGVYRAAQENERAARRNLGATLEKIRADRDAAVSRIIAGGAK